MLDFNAGKYAIFVWPAYGVTAVVFGVLIIDTLWRAWRWRRAARAASAEKTAA